MRSQVERTIHAELSDVPDIRFEAHVQQLSKDAWQLRVDAPLEDSGRARVLTVTSCAEAIKAAVVMISMAISAHESAATSPTEAVALPPAPSAEIAAPSVPETPQAPVRLSAAVALALDLGVLPGFAPGIDAELSLRWSTLRLTVLGTLLPAQSAYLPDGVRGGDFGLGLGALLACAAHSFGAIAAIGCGGFELGWISVRGLGVRTRSATGRLAYGPRLELGLVWQVAEELGLFGRVGVTLPLARDQFVLNDDPGEAVHRPGAASLRTTLGAEWTF